MLISYVLDGRPARPRHGRAGAAAGSSHEPISFKTRGRDRQGAEELPATSPLEPATCYAAEDADITLRLYRLLRPRLAREGLLTVYETLERPLPAVLARDGAAPASGSIPTGCASSPTTSPCAWPSFEAEAHGAGRPAVQPRQPQADRRRAVRRDGPAGRQEDRHRRLAHRRLRCWRSWPPRATRCRACCSTGASSPSSRAPTPTPWSRRSRRRTGRVHTSYALASTTTGRLVVERSQPAEHPGPHRGGPQDPQGLRRRARATC